MRSGQTLLPYFRYSHAAHGCFRWLITAARASAAACVALASSSRRTSAVSCSAEPSPAEQSCATTFAIAARRPWRRFRGWQGYSWQQSYQQDAPGIWSRMLRIRQSEQTSLTHRLHCRSHSASVGVAKRLLADGHSAGCRKPSVTGTKMMHSLTMALPARVEAEAEQRVQEWQTYLYLKQVTKHLPDVRRCVYWQDVYERLDLPRLSVLTASYMKLE